jgi:large subunit ribosomal protein L6
MSRKGKQPIVLPKGVEVKVADRTVHVKGPKGTLHEAVAEGIIVKVADGEVHVSLAEDHKDQRDWHGLSWALINNMVLGTSAGFEKKLELIGIGYRAAVAGKFLDLQVGFSHPTKVPIPEGVTVKVDKTFIIITGIKRQVVGQFAATVRGVKPPEPYQGKGIRYVDEFVRKKAGKAAAAKSK